jgi:hypothetical protein
MNHCAVCGVECTLKCSACKSVAYCGKEHQKSDWKHHKPNCHNTTLNICSDENEVEVWFAKRRNPADENEYWRFPTREELRDNIPAKLSDERLFYCGWEIASLGHIYLIYQYDYRTDIASCYISLGDRDNAEFGSIMMDEIREAYNKYKKTFKQVYPLIETFAHGPVPYSEFAGCGYGENIDWYKNKSSLS